MQLIADSGSSKTDWVLLDHNKVMEYTSTAGFNPFFHDETYISDEVFKNNVLQFTRMNIEDIHFFGAGCSSVERNQLVQRGLQRVFQNAKIQVDHDIAGAVYATCGHQAGISCIIGTGSNCVYFDGTQIHHYTSALGYILGDEGSGSYLGKILARDYINGDMPKEIKAHLEAHLDINKELILEHVYKKNNANKYLASLAKPLLEVREHKYVNDMIVHGFNLFIEHHVSKIPNYKNIPLHFVGSIASLYQEELKQACSAKGISISKIVQKPIEELAQYFILKR